MASVNVYIWPHYFWYILEQLNFFDIIDSSMGLADILEKGLRILNNTYVFSL